jgi:uncharacterized paraquat-inducible protein A
MLSAMQMATEERRGVRCPQCGRIMPLSKLIFREDFRCIRCQVPLYVSVTYSRVLVALSGLSGLVLLWVLGIRELGLFLFCSPLCLPLGVLVMTLMVRVAPFVVPPRLYLGKPPSAITKLDLSAGGRDDKS